MRRGEAALFALVGALIGAVVLAACGGDEPVVLTATDAPFVPVLETTDLRVGDERIVLSLLDRSEEPRFGAGASFRARLFEPTEGGIRYRAEASLERVEIEGRSYYVARDAPLDHAGDWAIAVTAALADGRSESSPRVGFPVRAAGLRPAVGDAAPALASPTLDDGAIGELTGAAEPEPLLYGDSVGDLVEAGRPFLLLFATPGRCGGQPTCRRALAQAAGIARAGELAGELAVVHVEPFGRPRGAALQEMIDGLNEAWGIRVEPQFWLVDGAGRVAGRWAVVVGDGELGEAIGGLGR